MKWYFKHIWYKASIVFKHKSAYNCRVGDAIGSYEILDYMYD